MGVRRRGVPHEPCTVRAGWAIEWIVDLETRKRSVEKAVDEEGRGRWTIRSRFEQNAYCRVFWFFYSIFYFRPSAVRSDAIARTLHHSPSPPHSLFKNDRRSFTPSHSSSSWCVPTSTTPSSKRSTRDDNIILLNKRRHVHTIFFF